MSKKRTLDSFFQSSSKKTRTTEAIDAGGISSPSEVDVKYSTHPTYPFPVPHLPASIASALNDSCPAAHGKEINDQPDLDLVYFQPYIARQIESEFFRFLRRSLFFYRVEYKIHRGNVQTQIHTPRFTTVFGVDETSTFSPDGILLDSITGKPIPANRYKTCKPRPIPQCLDELRKNIQAHNPPHTFNFCLVNYYATGTDSISYHSDDEHFLGPNPTIASLSLGARRDFLLKHKPSPHPPSPNHRGSSTATSIQKFPLASGDMLLMRGPTQANWLHSIPKRRTNTDHGLAEHGRINITFRKALGRAGTENYYRYNVGADAMAGSGAGVGAGGPEAAAGAGGGERTCFRWDEIKRELSPCLFQRGERKEEEKQ